MNIMLTTESKKYSGKYFSPDDIERINQIIITNPKANRAALSRLVCEQFKWFKMDGNLKEMSCRVAMIKMERDELIVLPKPLHKKHPCHAHKKKNASAATNALFLSGFPDQRLVASLNS